MSKKYIKLHAKRKAEIEYLGHLVAVNPEAIKLASDIASFDNSKGIEFLNNWLSEIGVKRLEQS